MLGRSTSILWALSFAGALHACSSAEAPGIQDSGASPQVDQGQTPAMDMGSSAFDLGNGALDAGAPADAGPPPPMDQGTPMIIDDCNPITQDCPPADKCVVENPVPLTGAECVPQGNDFAFGEECTGQDCEIGLVCVRSQTSTTSSCMQICDLAVGTGCEGLGGQTGDEYECRTRLTGTNWGACTQLPPVCNPYTQDPCGQDEACQPFLRRTGDWDLRCRPAGNAGISESCGSDVRCQRGLACISNPAGVAACRQICELDADCGGMATCTGAVNEPPLSYCVE